MVAMRNLLVGGAALSVEAFSARPLLAPNHAAAVVRSAPVMEMVPARRAQLAGLLGATITGITAQGASAATGPSSTPWAYSTFLDAVEAGQIEKVSLASDGKQVLSIDKDGNRHESLLLPGESANLIKLLTSKNVVFAVQAPPEPSAGGAIAGVLANLAFPIVIIGGLLFLQRRNGGGGMPGGGGGMNPMNLGKSKSKIEMEPETGVTFKDVAGCEGSKQELMEIVEFLKNPSKYSALGAKIPRGAVMEGPPGTGKTLLARAVAGEAGVPFISASGSEFVEMFVGVGASRVRDLFGQAKKNAPCIIFIDEIDAVGRQRGGGQGGGNDEREQTLNQILTEMDGFEGNPGIIVIAATNRADVLDSALLRPGRFDRRIMVDNPDFSGRVAILGVHARGKPLEDDVDLESIARRTPGFSGASLANLMNEAAIFAARKDKVKIGNEQISDALDRVTLGPEKKNAEISMQKRELVAYHEAGHAVVGALIPDYDQVAKITITPRGGAGGLTFFAPNEDRTDSGLYSRQYLESMMAVALGGRIAEEIIFGEDEITTGASNDLERVSSTAKRMVMEFGMSEKIGQVALAGGQGGQQQPMSAETKVLIDAEVSRLVQGAYTRAKQLLLDNRESLDKLAVMLCEKETVTAEEFAQILTDSKVSISEYTVYA